MILAVNELQILRGVLDVNNSAGAVFDVDPPRLDQFVRLTAAQTHRGFPVPGSAAVSEAVAALLHAPAQSFVSGHPSQFDERLTFEWRRLSILAVIIHQALEGSGQRAGFAVRSEPEIDMKDAFL